MLELVALLFLYILYVIFSLVMCCHYWCFYIDPSYVLLRFALIMQPFIIDLLISM